MPPSEEPRERETPVGAFAAEGIPHLILDALASRMLGALAPTRAVRFISAGRLSLDPAAVLTIPDAEPPHS